MELEQFVLVIRVFTEEKAYRTKEFVTSVTGARLKESGYINKSLLSLGTVISKLSSAGDER